MKKFLLAAAFAALSVMGVSAQDYLLNNPSNHAYFGIRVGGEVTCPGKFKANGESVKVFKNGGGFEAGAIYNVPVVANFYVEPGLKLYYNAYGLDDFVTDQDDLVDGSVRKFGMRVPVMLGYHFDFTPEWKVYVFTGPELEVGFTADAHEKVNGKSHSDSLYGDEAIYNRVDCLWGFGAGVSYQKFYFGVSGSVGMCNMLKDADPVKFHENRATFTLGYNF